MQWWRYASIYQIYPRSFFDANNDGIGDLNGVVTKLEYLKQLGIDAIWLSPFYPSPLHDGGYDVADPRDVAADLGGLAAFDALRRKCDQLNIKILIDLVPNHFSIEHKWFKKAVIAGPGSKERSRFHFLDGRGEGGELPPNNWISLFGGPAWTRITETDGTPGQWYLHIFDSSQPDLNWTNPEVENDFLDTLKFWLNRGVSGFRVDVAVGLAKDMSYADDLEPQLRVDAMRLDLYDPENPESGEGIRKWAIDSPIFDRDEVHLFYEKWREVFSSYSDDVFAVAEAWAYPTSRSMAYAKSLGQVFNFDFMVVPFNAKSLAKTTTEILETAVQYDSTPTWVLSNHDVSRVVSRMGGGESGLAKAKALAVLAHFLPGSIYVYQGEELGLSDAKIPAELRLDPIWEKSGHTQIGRDGCRAPIPWDSQKPNRGFSAVSKTWLPSPDNWQVEDVVSQDTDPHSTLSLYRSLLNLRKSHPAWNVPLVQTKVDLDKDLLIVRRGELGLCLVNTGSEPIKCEIPSGMKLLVTSNPADKALNDQTSIEIPAFSAAIYS